MACGDRYHASVRTEQGYTPSNACGVVCLPTDYDGWYVEASRWDAALRRAWEALQALSARRRQEVNPSLVARVAQYRAVFDALPTSSWSSLFDLQHWTIRRYVDDAIASILEATCLLELTENAIRAGGERPPAVSTGRGQNAVAPSLPRFGGGGGIFGGGLLWYAVAAAAGGYLVYRLTDRKGPER